MDNKKQIADFFEKEFEKVVVKAHKRFKTEEGDITPAQQIELERLTDAIVSLFTQQVSQNITGNDPISITTVYGNEIAPELTPDERGHLKKVHNRSK